MQLSVIILNYNVRYFLELCLKSVQTSIETLDAEIIVVDNNSQDDSCRMVKDMFPSVVLIENTTNYGFSKGNNMAVKKAKGKYLCILNPDTVVAEDTFTTLLNFAELQENVGVVGCRLIDGSGQFLPESKRNIPTPIIAIKKILGNSSKYYANQIDEKNIGKADVFVGAFMLIKRDVYTSVGGFDEDYFMYGEDVDLSFKIKKAGFNSYYYGKSAIIHYKGESTLKDHVYAERFFGAMQIFYKKHFKRHIVFDSLVWIGVKLAYLFRNSSKVKRKKIESYLFFSDELNDNLNAVLSKEVSLINSLVPSMVNSEVVFDANVLTYKEIIEHFSTINKNATNTLKILPKNSRFIIGSNDSKNRGEIITF